MLWIGSSGRLSVVLLLTAVCNGVSVRPERVIRLKANGSYCSSLRAGLFMLHSYAVGV